MSGDWRDDLYFRQVLIGPMANFVYLIGSRATREAVAVDPAWDVGGVLRMLEADEMRLTGALVTHTHADHAGGDMLGQHVEGAAELLEQAAVKIYVHKSEAALLGLGRTDVVKTDEHSELALGAIRVRFIHTPGHTPGSQCFALQDRLVSGDTLFIGSCGRTDLPGSNAADLYDSLTGKLMKLDESMLVFPGHNYAADATSTTIAREKAHNPFCNFASKSEFLQAMGYGG